MADEMNFMAFPLVLIAGQRACRPNKRVMQGSIALALRGGVLVF